jgi:hypothetical protein
LRRQALHALFFLLAMGLVVISNTTYRKRKQARAILEDREEQYVAANDNARYVDFGILLCVVESDPRGAELVDGAPPMRILRRHRFGGLLDTRSRPKRLVGPSQNPVVWFCSADQEQILLHDDPEKPAQLVYGSEGAGKTRVLAMWHALQVLKHVGERREGGQMAPTNARLESLLNEMREIYPSSWYKYRTSRKIIRFCDGTGLRLRSTHRRSKAQGSPLQSYNWSWAADDEIQDSTAEVDNVTARLRTAKGGAKHAPRMGTATAKDDTEWRNCKDKLEASGLWMRRTLLGIRSPFVHPDHWEAMRASMSPREYQRRVMAMDVGPERQTYPCWSRDHNLIHVPDIGWHDVTSTELAPWGPSYGALIGHDPGTLFDVSLIIKAYRVAPSQPRPFWVVVGEVTTEQTTTEQHVVELLDTARRQFQLNMLDWRGRPQESGATMLVRADPYGNNDSKPDRSIYTIFRNAGIAIHPAAYSQGGGKPGRVPKNEGIELVNTLLCNAAGERRLYVAKDKLGQPLAPRLVKALESSERDLAGKAETQRKDEQDQSHWPSALRYALWAIERPRLSQAMGLR